MSGMLINQTMYQVSVEDPGSEGVLTLNSDGSLDVSSANQSGQTYTLEYRVFQISNPNNFAIGTVNISVLEDNTAPVFNETLPTDVTVSCGSVPAAVVLTATDNCGTATVSYTETRADGACANSYILTRTWTARDECDNETTHVHTITVEDNTAPVFNETLPTDLTVSCGSVPAAVVLTATDNCGTATVSYTETRADGACANSYILTRTWTAKDECDNETTHVQTITVEDNTAPVFNETLPTDVTVSCGSVPAAVVLTATDNCGDVEVVFTEEILGEECGIEVIRKWVATDACGNSVEHIQVVNILASAIIANDDDFGIIQFDFSGIVGDVFMNDSLNGNQITPSLVQVEIVDFGGLNGVEINSDGLLILVSGGLNTAGSYIVEYRICEVANPSNCDTAFIYLTIENPKIDILVEKTSNDVVIWEGDEFDYQITVRNIGSSNATDVLIEDLLPVGVSFISQEIQEVDFELDYSFEIQGSRLVWNVSSLPVESEIVIRVKVLALPLPIDESLSITNLVTVSGNEEDINLDNNSDTDINYIRSFFIPNVITPNGDGSNDTFVINGLGKYSSHSIVIFNRFGDHIFGSEDYQNNWAASGSPSGTYYYVLKGIDHNGREHVFKGWIQVIK